MAHKFIEIKDGIIVNIAENADGKLPNDFAHYIEVPSGFDGRAGDKWPLWFDGETGRKHTNEELVEMGELIDNRGVWHNKKTRERKTITEYNDKIDTEEWTKETPIENEPYQKWDEATKKFVVDAEEKEKAEKERQLGELKVQIKEYEEKALRPQREIPLGIDVEENQGYLQTYQAEIMKIRPEVERLEAELKSA